MNQFYMVVIERWKLPDGSTRFEAVDQEGLYYPYRDTIPVIVSADRVADVIISLLEEYFDLCYDSTQYDDGANMLMTFSTHGWPTAYPPFPPSPLF